MPVDDQGRDWMETHVGIPGAALTLAMLQLTPDLKFQLSNMTPDTRSARPPRSCDRGGHHLPSGSTTSTRPAVISPRTVVAR